MPSAGRGRLGETAGNAGSLLAGVCEVTPATSGAIGTQQTVERRVSVLATRLVSSSVGALLRTALSHVLAPRHRRETDPVVGTDSAGTAVWSRWAPLHCDHAGRGSTGWWAPDRTEDLEAVIGTFLAAATADGHDGWSTLDYLATAAVVAGESGFVEQRLTLAAAALEHLVWTTDVLEGPYTEDTFGAGKRGRADVRLRQHLAGIRVPVAVDPDRTPALAAHLPGLDGPAAVLRVRNMLTHPKTPSELYEQPGLIAEAARLACRYLDLGILHRTGYAGRVRDRTKVTGWGGESHLVP